MSLRDYVSIARPSHWFKNVFMLPGVLLALFFQPELLSSVHWASLLAGLLATCLVASSNYVLNEILDAPRDAFHPEKQKRPVPSGAVRVKPAYAEWVLLAAAGLAVAFSVGVPMGWTAAVLWIAGTLYNVPPIRMKDLPYADVLSESVNNPLRFLLGWYAAGAAGMPPVSMLMAYWMFGAFLMAMKRFAEYRHIGDPVVAGRYRKSFASYTSERLLESLSFYGAMFGMWSGVFIARYRVELCLAIPVVAYAMAYYMHLGFKKDSPVQNPERLYRQPKLMVLCTAAFVACAVLLLVEWPAFEHWTRPAPCPETHGRPAP